MNLTKSALSRWKLFTPFTNRRNRFVREIPWGGSVSEKAATWAANCQPQVGDDYDKQFSISRDGIGRSTFLLVFANLVSRFESNKGCQERLLSPSFQFVRDLQTSVINLWLQHKLEKLYQGTENIVELSETGVQNFFIGSAILEEYFKILQILE